MAGTRSKMAKLIDLPVELLELILKHFNIVDLCRFAQTCKRFNLIVQNELKRQVKINRNLIPLVTNQLKTSLIDRSALILTPFKKYRISHNWKIGRYKEHILLEQRVRFMPWMYLDRDHLWFSRGNKLRRYNRNRYGAIHKQPEYAAPENNSEITRFRIKNNKIILGLRNGTVAISNGTDVHNRFQKHAVQDGEPTDVNAVDISNSTFATGTRWGCVRIWPWPDDMDRCWRPLNPLMELNHADRVWSIGYNSSNFLAIGTSGHLNPPLSIVDIQKQKRIHSFLSPHRSGDGILDIHWQSNNVLLTCGYESTIRLWDLRVERCVRHWDEPYNSTLYCLQTDDLYTIMCGTQNHGKVTLWDQRQKNFVQMYFLSSFRNESTPVFSVAFDATVLYGALDRSLNILNFWSGNNRIRNYNFL